MSHDNIYPNDPYSARALRCIADGTVIPLSELNDEAASQRTHSNGYAVYAGHRLSRITSFFAQQTDIRITAPADGVVTDCTDSLTLRTGDGILITVSVGNAYDHFLPEVGDKIRIHDTICMLPRTVLDKNGLNGAVAVLFNDMSRITELHVLTGRRRAGARTAFYKIAESHNK